MTKLESLIQQWRNFQLAKIRNMPYRCKLETSFGVTFLDAVLVFITTEQERRLEITAVGHNAKCVLLFDELNGYVPHLRRGAIDLILGQQRQRATFTFATAECYSAVVDELKVFIREIANVPTPLSSDETSGSSSNEEL